MKKIIVISLILGTLSFLLISCGSSQGHCDAYGNKSGSVKN